MFRSPMCQTTPMIRPARPTPAGTQSWAWRESIAAVNVPDATVAWPGLLLIFETNAAGEGDNGGDLQDGVGGFGGMNISGPRGPRVPWAGEIAHPGWTTVRSSRSRNVPLTRTSA